MDSSYQIIRFLSTDLPKTLSFSNSSSFDIMICGGEYTMKIPNYTLRNNVLIPVVGFGTWQIPNGDTAYQATLDALKAGYRHIDTAAAYGNEESIGRAIKDIQIARKDIFITSKLKAELKGYQTAKDEFQKTIDRLGVEYLDLYLIHAPRPWGSSLPPNAYQEQNNESWRAFVELYHEGKIRSIGVSNFHPNEIHGLVETTGFVPHVDQIYLCPGSLQEETVAYGKEFGMLIEAYSPFATGRLFKNPRIFEIAEQYGKNAGQIAIRWSLQKGHLPLPKSTHAERIGENLNVFDFELSQETMKELDSFAVPR